MKLIVIDRIDGAGKDTVAEIVTHSLRLQGYSVSVRNHPSPSTVGVLTLNALRKRGAFARVFASVLFLFELLISSWRLRRETSDYVVFVRFIVGSAYVPLNAHQLIYAILRSILPKGDMMLFVDAEPEIALRRIKERRNGWEMFENLESLKLVRERAFALLGTDWAVIKNNWSLSELRIGIDPHLEEFTEK